MAKTRKLRGKNRQAKPPTHTSRNTEKGLSRKTKKKKRTMLRQKRLRTQSTKKSAEVVNLRKRGENHPKEKKMYSHQRKAGRTVRFHQTAKKGEKSKRGTVKGYEGERWDQGLAGGKAAVGSVQELTQKRIEGRGGTTDCAKKRYFG